MRGTFGKGVGQKGRGILFYYYFSSRHSKGVRPARRSEEHLPPSKSALSRPPGGGGGAKKPSAPSSRGGGGGGRVIDSRGGRGGGVSGAAGKKGAQGAGHGGARKPSVGREKVKAVIPVCGVCSMTLWMHFFLQHGGGGGAGGEGEEPVSHDEKPVKSRFNPSGYDKDLVETLERDIVQTDPNVHW